MKPKICPVCGSEKIKAQPMLRSREVIRQTVTYRCEQGHVFFISKSAAS
jgi:predicted RNA-binding Zn-ribbon protein involved in translation (DUF1610 family)